MPMMMVDLVERVVLITVAAGATDFRIRIFWMNVRLHKRSGTKLSRNRGMTRRIFASSIDCTRLLPIHQFSQMIYGAP